MTEKYTETLTFSQRGRDSKDGKWAGFKVGDKWANVYAGHADKVPVGQPCDVEYAISEKGRVFINKVNGVDVSRAPVTSQASGGGPLGSKPSSSAPASGDGERNSWAGMGPENRARMAVKGILESRYGSDKADLPGEQALAMEMVMVYNAWLKSVEGKGMPPSGSLGEALGGDNIPDFDGDPGASGPDDYA